ncbi:MAG: hypothetical protein WD044_06570 [Dongiaceae bacterium]
MNRFRAVFMAVTISILTTESALAGAVTESASSGSVKERYLQYHAAMRAAELCAGYNFDRRADNADIAWIAQAKSRIGAFIDSELKYQINVGERLDLIEQAKTGTEMKIEANGCDDPAAVELLSVFETEIAPLLPPL